MAMVRTDLATQLKNEAIKVETELETEYYNKRKLKPFYSQFCNVKKLSSLEWKSNKMGGGSAWAQTISMIGVTELLEREEGDAIKFAKPTLGFPIWVKRKNFALGVEMTMETNRDFKALSRDLKNWIIDMNFPAAAELTKEKFAIGMINEGAFTAGSNYFNNNIPGITPGTYGNTVYDGKPLFTASGNERTNKAGSTYYNALPATALTYDNLVTADTLLLDTIAKKEDDQPFDNNLDNFLMTNRMNDVNAKRLLNSEWIPGNNQNDINAMNGKYKHISNPYMTPGTASWVIGNKYGINFYEPDGVTVDVWQDYDRKILKCSASIDIAAYVQNWRALVGCNLPTS